MITQTETLNTLIQEMREAGVVIVLRDGKPMMRDLTPLERSAAQSADFKRRLQPYKEHLLRVAGMADYFDECEFISEEGEER